MNIHQIGKPSGESEQHSSPVQISSFTDIGQLKNESKNLNDQNVAGSSMESVPVQNRPPRNETTISRV